MNIKCLVLSGIASVLTVVAFVWTLIYHEDIVAMIAIVVGLAMLVVCIWGLIYACCSKPNVGADTA